MFMVHISMQVSTSYVGLVFALGHWVKGRACPLPNIYYLKIPTFFQTRYIFVTNVQSTHQKVYYYSWLQLMTYFFSSTEARKIFSSCRIISGGFIGCLFHPPLHFVAKSQKKSSLFSIFVRLHKFEYVRKSMDLFDKMIFYSVPLKPKNNQIKFLILPHSGLSTYHCN